MCMDIKLKHGKYILAVSGGVDSMALLHRLTLEPDLELVVAHFNHNMRPSSAEDQKLVKKAAKGYGLCFETAEARKGELSGEDDARNARYGFLRAVKEKHKADAIITAHHQDDKLETALLNIIRGTGRKGLSAISNNKNIIRPLLNIPKETVIGYARRNKLAWNEDSTNYSPEYLRNYLRLKIIPRLTAMQRENLIYNIDKVAITNKTLDEQIATLSHLIYQNKQIDRDGFSALPSDVGRELLVHWLRIAGTGEFDRRTIGKLSMAIKTAKNGSVHPIKQSHFMTVDQQFAHFSDTL